MARPPQVSHRRSEDAGNTAASIRSRKVRKILKIEARADALRRQARAVELALTGTELGELRRARNATPR